MANYGYASYGSPADYTGGTNYTPTTGEVIGGEAAYRGSTGVSVQPYGTVAATPWYSALQGGIQLGTGLALIGGAIVTDVGSAGLATPVDAVAVAGGVSNVLAGLSNIQSAADGLAAAAPPVPVAPPSTGTGALTPTQAAQLATAATESTAAAASSAAAPQAVWDHDLSGYSGSTPHAAGFFMLIAFLMADFAQYNGGIMSGSNGLFVLNAPLALGVPSTAFPVFPPGDILTTDDLVSFLTRNNPSLTVQRIASGAHKGEVALFNADLGWTCRVQDWEFEWMKWYMYTPSSGAPKRSMTGDLNELFALIPIRF